MTPSRPFHKDDLAYVEQKITADVRQLLGFEWLRYDLAVPLVDWLLEAWFIWRNAFATTFKQTEKKRVEYMTQGRHVKDPRRLTDGSLNTGKPGAGRSRGAAAPAGGDRSGSFASWLPAKAAAGIPWGVRLPRPSR